MTLVISILALVITAIGSAAAVAGLNDEGRARFFAWSKTAATTTYKFGALCFVCVSLVNGATGVWLFSITPGDPSRRDILNLVLFLINIAIGLGGINRLIDLKLRKSSA